MKLIPLSRGLFALVDDEDYGRLSATKWYATPVGKSSQRFYAMRHGAKVNGKQSSILMHRVVMAAQPGLQVDHISGDSLDNRRENLRLCTVEQNSYNQGRRTNNTSGFKGVSWDKRLSKWVARIRSEGKKIHLGLYPTPAEAYSAYCAAADRFHGEFARTQ